MNISSAGAPPPAVPRQLVSQLTSNGLTAEKASLVATEATAAFQSAGNMSAGPAQKETVKAALEKRISADVASGKLSAEDAKAVYKTFEELDPAKQNGGQGPEGAGGPPPGGRPGAPPLVAVLVALLLEVVRRDHRALVKTAAQQIRRRLVKLPRS